MNILDKVKIALDNSPYNALLVLGHDHIRYLTGAMLPFRSAASAHKTAVLWIKGREPILVAPAALRGSFRNMGRIRNVQAYYPEGPSAQVPAPFEGPSKGPASLEEALSHLLTEEFSDSSGAGSGKAAVGISKERTPKRLFDTLSAALPGIQFETCDAMIEELRMVKTEAEQTLLEEAAFKTDHAISGAAHHVMVYASRPEKGLSEIIRVHCLERGLDVTGYESLAVGASGIHAAEPWPESPFYGVGGGKQLEKEELVRMEIRTSLNGYWSVSARLLTMGPATSEQAAAYSQLNSIREELQRTIKPGRSCKEIAQHIDEFCEKKGVEPISGHGLGHGIGVSPVEPPYLDRTDERELKEGMVLVLTPTVSGPKGELIRSYDTVIVRQSGIEVVGRYKDWSSPYKAVSSYQHGGG
ncbi:MAG: M24 family metallopeptidase [Spirochaetia bacterium]